MSRCCGNRPAKSNKGQNFKMGNFRLIKNLLQADRFRDHCAACGLWTVFELSLTDGSVCARCTYCGDSRHFARNVTEARIRAAAINRKTGLLAQDHPQLVTLSNLGEGVRLPWYVSPEREAPTKAA